MTLRGKREGRFASTLRWGGSAASASSLTLDFFVDYRETRRQNDGRVDDLRLGGVEVVRRVEEANAEHAGNQNRSGVAVSAFFREEEEDFAR